VAQQPKIIPDLEVDSPLLLKWLHSRDPHFIASSADFPHRRHDSQVVSEIPDVLEHWSMPPVAVEHEEQADQRRAALALLDTLIQENVQVALPEIKSVAGMFPAQSMRLIQRVSPMNSKTTLIDWVFNRDGMYRDPRSRAAAMILAKTPDSAFVYRILDGLQLHITLFVIPPNMGYGKGDQPPVVVVALAFLYRLPSDGRRSMTTPCRIGTEELEERTGIGLPSRNWQTTGYQLSNLKKIVVLPGAHSDIQKDRLATANRHVPKVAEFWGLGLHLRKAFLRLIAFAAEHGL
jgi:hypothetical protein